MLYKDLRTQPVNDGTSGGYDLADVHQLGWMGTADYATLARETVQTEIIDRLARYGIHVPTAP